MKTLSPGGEGRGEGEASQQSRRPMFFLCRLSDLDNPGTKEAEVHVQGRPHNIFLVRKGDSVFAYLNICPHAGQPLNRMRNRFLNQAETHLLCSAHAASFEIETGLCTGGPCAGKSLTPLPLHQSGDAFYLTETD